MFIIQERRTINTQTMTVKCFLLISLVSRRNSGQLLCNLVLKPYKGFYSHEKKSYGIFCHVIYIHEESCGRPAGMCVQFRLCLDTGINWLGLLSNCLLRAIHRCCIRFYGACKLICWYAAVGLKYILFKII